ncbi:2-oxoglutarate synthase subunit alpha [Hydrogenimonas thermophila]|uniref:2-oxoglutarate ferredoxin oxidoreductase, alpha subunit n=1 Tax=Hydrogenimonas thermophila TaxID=223786 RepID=A0A1I5QGT9_9BACT|nr:2-oxoglutarate synthase subunit alpha [Hydrogenimonas thermophila]WOE68872.1 2-oxoglutarate synthase subunit alpha [Hydrogenimonas thermophila]WOE71380.1 2-oxoglutarate synthase subunit alpha [Hydrogenimonas thermophila]SFP45261.1 2-oxoglutarate ferredoxin oxidoreductase, alpha subunit [Hydrogenimonas thermophila]
MAREIISSGNDLAAIAAVDAGCMFFGGYPITPSSEVMHTISDLLPKVGGACIQMEDEIGGICAAIGAAMSGVRSMTATSGPGISLKAENLGLAQMAEVPLVVVDVMRGGPSTGLPTRVSQGDVSQAKNPSHGDYKSITLCAGNLEECYTEVVRAFNIADRFMQPVIVLLDETIGHMHGKAVLPDLEEVKANIKTRKTFDGPAEEYKPYGVAQDEPAVLNPMFKGYRYHFTGLHHDAMGFPTEEIETCRKLIDRLFRKVDEHVDELEYNEEYMIDDADILIVAYGSVSLAAKEAINRLRDEGIKVGLFRPITLWPSPEKRLYELGQKFDKILSVELNMGQYLEEIQRATGRKDIAKLIKVNGRPFSPQDIIDKVKEL